MEKKKSVLTSIIALIVFIAVILGVIGAYSIFSDKPVTDKKSITVEVIHGDLSEKEFKISTDEKFLRGALEQEKLVSGSESEYGLFVETVDGETADSAVEQWWCITKGGEVVMSGIDTTPIADGDQFELTLKTGYDLTEN